MIQSIGDGKIKKEIRFVFLAVHPEWAEGCGGGNPREQGFFVV